MSDHKAWLETPKLKKAIDELIKKDWRFRRYLDFTLSDRTQRMQPRWFQRRLPRANREIAAECLRAGANDPDFDEAVFGPRAVQIAFANAIAPRRGQVPKFTKDFVARVDALVRAANSGSGSNSIRTHRIDGNRRPSGWGQRTTAVKTILLIDRGKVPTKQEIAEALVVYKQRLVLARRA